MGRGGRAPIRGGATAHLMGRGSLLSYSCFVSPFQVLQTLGAQYQVRRFIVI